MKTFHFGGFIRPVYKPDPEANEPEQAALYAILSDEETGGPVFHMLNHVAHNHKARPNTVVQQGEDFYVEGFRYQLATTPDGLDLRFKPMA